MISENKNVYKTVEQRTAYPYQQRILILRSICKISNSKLDSGSNPMVQLNIKSLNNTIFYRTLFKWEAVSNIYSCESR